MPEQTPAEVQEEAPPYVPEQAPIQADLAPGEGQEEWCPVCDTADLSSRP